LKNVEKDLATVVKKSGGQADRLVSIIKENGKVQYQIKGNLEAQVMQNVLTLILRSDADANFRCSEPELKTLRMPLSNIPQPEEDIPKEDNIFHLQSEELLKTNSSYW
jgi:hypothetical protein